jgi:hypothetical protein
MAVAQRLEGCLPTPRSYTSDLQNFRTIQICGVSHPVCGTLLRWPQERNMPPGCSEGHSSDSAQPCQHAALGLGAGVGW